LFVNSFRTRDAQRGSGFWNALGDGTFPTLDNYREVLFPDVGAGLWNALLNSASIAIVATIIPIAIAAFAAYAFAWIDFRGREWLFIGTVALLAVPSQVALIPLLSAYSNGVHWTIPFVERTITLFPDLDLSGQIPSVWLTHTGFAMPFAIFLLHNYIAGLPKDLFESAAIDGADHFKVFWRLVLPLSVPVLAAFAIFQFLWTWNDYLIALTMIGGNREALPATIVVASLAGEFGAREHLLTAGAFVITIFPLIVFFALQRFFVRGITAGSVKG
jgi:alpha-glucoside transport system permease protein